MVSSHRHRISADAGCVVDLGPCGAWRRACGTRALGYTGCGRWNDGGLRTAPALSARPRMRAPLALARAPLRRLGGFGAEIRAWTRVQAADAAERAQAVAATAEGVEASGWGRPPMARGGPPGPSASAGHRRSRVRADAPGARGELARRAIPLREPAVRALRALDPRLAGRCGHGDRARAAARRGVPADGSGQPDRVRARAGTVVRIAWAVEGVERMSPILEAGQFPWTADRVQRGEVVRFSVIDELPRRRRPIGRASRPWASGRLWCFR